MRKNYVRSFLFSCAVIIGITSAKAQEIENSVKQKVAGNNGNPSLIVFTKSSNYSLSQSKQLLKQQLKLGQYDDFKKIKSETDKMGYVHEKHQQYFKGVKVEFGTYMLHSKKGKVESMSGEFYDTDNVAVIPKLTKAQGLQSAMNHLNAKSYLWQDAAASKELGYKKPEGELVLLPIFDNLQKRGENIEKLRLAYKYDIFTIEPLGGADVYVDAITGDILFYNARVKHVDNFGHDGRSHAKIDNPTTKEGVIKTFAAAMVSGTAETRYSGTQNIETTLSGSNYTLNDASRKVYTRNANNLAPLSTSLPYITNYTEFTDNDNNWTAAEFDNVDKDNAALDAHWGAMMTYDYWLNIHGRNSYDNAGSQLRSYVHVDNNYDNAFWYFNVMSYGDGSSDGTEGNGNFDALTSIDVAAHEIGHGICEYTSNLAYQRESGAMNEGFSDIWAAAVEHFAKGNGSDTNPDAAIWLIGDEIDRRAGSAALRSMSNPSSLGQPDTYGGTYWIDVNCGTPTQVNDYCGVHTNSGVLNFWFYLATVGGSGTNDIGNAYNVSGIGISKAAVIAYRLESFYLSSNSTYADARVGSIQAAIDLYGAGSAEEIAVTNAWHAVGIGNAYGDNSVNYCASTSGNVNDEYIGRVQLNTIDNASGGQFYSNFTAISTDLSKDTQYTITITPTWTGTVYSEGYAVWIDYNQNGDFTDSGELVYSRAATTTTPISGSFTVPATAVDGPTRMRVSMKYNGIPTSCESFSYGEVEDYTVNIGGSGGSDTEAPMAPSSLTASNITSTTATLSWSASTDNIGVTGYNVYQSSTNIGTVTGTTANITGLTANTAYSFSVTAIDAAGNESAASNVATFTTPSGADTEAPSAPSSLAASNITLTTIDLSWSASTDNVGVTGYDVYQDGSFAKTVTSTSTTMSGLNAGTSYSFYVIAKDAAGNSSTASNTANATTQSSGGGTSLTIFDGSFETGWEGWIDGGGDVSLYSGSRSYDGNNSILIRDNSGSASAMTLGSFDVTSYDNIEIVFFFYAYSMETGEDFWVRFYDGSTWNTVAAYAAGTNFNNNSFYTATVNISAASYNFPSNAQFGFQCDASSNTDYIYIDKVTITATSAGGAFAPSSIAELGGAINGFTADLDNPTFEIEGLEILPNPASIEATLRVELDIEDNFSEDVKMNIFDLQGKLIQSKKWEGVTSPYFEKTIDISQLQRGIYFVNIATSKGSIETQKLIVK